MKFQQRSWIQAVHEGRALWGVEPEFTLMKYLPLISSGPVLDLGMGNGRNALFFAKLGFEVDCVDISKTYVKKCQDRAAAEKLAMRAFRADLRSFEIPRRRYALIIASKILQLFPKSEIEAIAKKMVHGLARQGVVYVRVFSVEQVSNYSRDKQEVQLVEANTYYVPRYRLHFHYFSKEEVLGLFSKLKSIQCVEGLETDLKFKKPRKQWIIEYVGQRTR